MENVERNIDKVRRELEKANAEVIRLSSYIADVNHEKEKCNKLANDKIARLDANLKVLEGQYDSLVIDKFKATKRLAEVETQCENYQREAKQLKEQNRKQQISIRVFQQEINAFNDEKKKKIRAKFYSFKSQAKVVDEQIMKFLKNDSLRTDTSGDRVEYQDVQVPPSPAVTSTNGVADRNNHPGLRGRIHASSYNYESMRKTSGTTVKRSVTRATIAMTKMKSVKANDLFERKYSAVATEQKTDVQLSLDQIVERPKRFMKCTNCLKPYRSTPEKAFCGCQYVELEAQFF